MATNQAENVYKQLNDLTVESTRTCIDAAFLAQRQSAELAKAWLTTLSANGEAQREIAGRFMRQAQQAQGLVGEMVRESFRTGSETFGRAAENARAAR